jgi:DUF917 family protein
MTRAKKIVQAVGGQAAVSINPEKPGRGNFVVRVNGIPVVELLAMKRPFPELKALDMDEVSQKVLSMIQES